MGIKLKIFYPVLEQVIPKGEPLILNGNTLGECLGDLVRRYPAARELLFDDQDRLIRHLFIYVNEESLDQPDLAAAVNPGDTLIVASLITGG